MPEKARKPQVEVFASRAASWDYVASKLPFSPIMPPMQQT
jgi:hypothetical protein